jgi:hypothetical protein
MTNYERLMSDMTPERLVALMRHDCICNEVFKDDPNHRCWNCIKCKTDWLRQEAKE